MAEQESMLSMDETSSFETSNFQKMSDVTQGQHELSSNNVSQHLVFSLDLPAIKREILIKCKECQDRGLTQSYKWLAEILFALKKVPFKSPNVSNQSDMMDRSDNENELSDQDIETFLMARGYFDLKEYDRCAFFTSSCIKNLEQNSEKKSRKTGKLEFIHFYSRYLSGEKKRLDNMTDIITSVDCQQLTYLQELRCELQKLNEARMLDGYCTYLYGIVLKRLELNDKAKTVLIEAVNLEPCLWGAWLELAYHVSDRTALQSLELPDHWIKNIFLAHTYLELQLNEQALEIYFALQEAGLQESTFLLAQVAIAFHNMREVDRAISYFQQLGEVDPYRLDNLDTYSNLLYVKEQRVELATLHIKQLTSTSIELKRVV